MFVICGKFTANRMRRLPVLVLLCLAMFISAAAADRSAVTVSPETASPDTTSPGQIEQLLNRYFETSEDSDESTNLESAERPYERFEGRTIRKIHIKLLGLTSGLPRKIDTGSIAGLSKWVEACHFDTKAHVVRNYLLIREGDRVDPRAIADSERLLRETGLFSLVNIMAVPISRKSRQVDLVIFARDLWTLGANIRLDLLPDIVAKVYERNLWGYGHSAEVRTRHEPGEGHVQEVRGFYRLSNIYGSFILGEVGWNYKQNLNKNRHLYFIRTPIAPMIRLNGALRMDSKQLSADPDSFGVSNDSRFDSYNCWLGYSIPLEHTNMGLPGDTRLFPAFRAHWVDYLDRPSVQSERWMFDFQDRFLLLGSLQLSSSQYLKGKNIYGYGPTEDIPVGFLAILNSGQYYGSMADYRYAGGKIAGGARLGGVGVINGLFEMGSYRYNSTWFDTILRAETRWFSELSELSSFRLRHFLDVSFTSGKNLLGPDRIELNEKNGLRGIESSDVSGSAHCALNWESVAFTPWKVLGFQIAGYLFTDVAAVGKDTKSLWSARYYTSHGIGIRIKNRSLVFNAVDLRFVFFPNLPEGADQEWIHVGSLRKLDPNPISVESPTLIEYP
jgi:hypothetical protein